MEASGRESDSQSKDEPGLESEENKDWQSRAGNRATLDGPASLAGNPIGSRRSKPGFASPRTRLAERGEVGRQRSDVPRVWPGIQLTVEKDKPGLESEETRLARGRGRKK